MTGVARIAAISIVLALGACASGAGDLRYSQAQGISADIDASRWSGPGSLNPGQRLDSPDEPNGAIPWRQP